jgi:hypothetical protein
MNERNHDDRRNNKRDMRTRHAMHEEGKDIQQKGEGPSCFEIHIGEFMGFV